MRKYPVWNNVYVLNEIHLSVSKRESWNRISNFCQNSPVLKQTRTFKPNSSYCQNSPVLEKSSEKNNVKII